MLPPSGRAELGSVSFSILFSSSQRYRRNKGSWFSIFPKESQLFRGAKKLDQNCSRLQAGCLGSMVKLDQNCSRIQAGCLGSMVLDSKERSRGASGFAMASTVPWGCCDLGSHVELMKTNRCGIKCHYLFPCRNPFRWYPLFQPRGR
ncbi:hypothetical protein KP509_36G057200 [Ceratopteris richardii]|uniref:Uncharacterized protein n=1 Tax=Ceratopteris richardii TaxID=49495 RepID=A0A8T2QEQ5_CERRI|nr:hypothetical protein KP509_36G057200 [Ceratopteris richardii]